VQPTSVSTAPLLGRAVVLSPDEGWTRLPPEARLAMPLQSLREGVLRRPSERTSPASIGWRRALVFGGSGLLTLLAAWSVVAALWTNGFNAFEAVFTLVFVSLFAWITLSAMSAVGGFFSLLKNNKKLGIDPSAERPVLTTRTAVLMPTYNEEPQRLLAGLRAIAESIALTGQGQAFDFFVLSDTRKPDIGLAEEQGIQALLQALPWLDGRLFYRRRQSNAGRKAGNVADWVQRFGGAYPQFLQLDADSLMEGDTVVRLVGALEVNPTVGLIQSLPVVIGGKTVFARMQQFGSRVYGPVVAHGVAWWHGSESNYWGHNAVIRTQAFAQSAGLPELPGKKPFGGHVLSHDFVEVALMRRNGWAAHMVPYLGGSFEEGPPTLTDLLVRDRRWCQGNLQHAKVVPTKGLHWVNRVHLAMGIGHYFTAPLWAALILLGILIPLTNGQLDLSGQTAFSPAHYWHGSADGNILWVFLWSMGLLFLPKVLGFVALLLNPPLRRACGGVGRVLVSMLLESLMAALIAPIVMVVQSRGVLEVLRGKDSGWEAQQRDADGVAWGLLLRQYGGLSMFGVALGAAAFYVSPPLALWLSPVVLGLVLAVPMVAWSSRQKGGERLRRWGLLKTPEETNEPLVVLMAQGHRQAVDKTA